MIAVGYGTTQGAGHPVKRPEEVSKADAPVPAWFQRGVQAALLAPTAMNQQKFTFTLQGDTVAAKAGAGFYSKVDLGIAKYHLRSGRGPGTSGGRPDGNGCENGTAARFAAVPFCRSLRFSGPYAFLPCCSAMAWRNISSVLRMDASREYCLACPA